ncbi:MAG: DUF1028 domain-containing protein [Chloroflexota bacterium]
MVRFNTFSIVAYDPDEKACGVAVASKFLAAGAVVSWARAGVGAVATQALAKVGYGPDGLDMLASGMSAEETLAKLTAADPGSAERQVGIVDTNGGAAAHTGSECFDWAGHVVGDGFTCQGNILTGEIVVNAMASAYRTAEGELADRLMAALMAGDRAGGDRRGKQSAAVMVMKPGGGYGGDNDHYLDLRVDDHLDPVTNLAELVQAHHLFFGTPDPSDQLAINADIARELQTMLIEQDYMQGDADGTWDELTKQAFWALVGNENLEERWNINGQTDRIDRVVLDYLRKRFAK